MMKKTNALDFDQVELSPTIYEILLPPEFLDIPENNDGYEFCIWCGAPTKEVPGFNVTEVYDICVECER